MFIVDVEDVPMDEHDVYRPFLPDRAIGRYALPEETGKRIFYPYIDGRAITASQLRTDYPKTWERLNGHREALSSRRSVKASTSEWWRPTRPRSPHDILAPKIVVPEVSLLPRFGLDPTGRWIVSHSPFVRARVQDGSADLLFVLAAVLNSSVPTWFIELNARKYRDGYNKIGVSLLRRLPIPDLRRVPNVDLRRIIATVRDITASFRDVDYGLASTLDELVLRDLYRLSDDDITLLKPQVILGETQGNRE